MRFWNEERTQCPVINNGDLEKYVSQESVTGAGSLGQIEGEYAREENVLHWQKAEVHLNWLVSNCAGAKEQSQGSGE